MDEKELLKEIKIRLFEGWRLKKDLDWLVQMVEQYLKEKENDDAV